MADAGDCGEGLTVVLLTVVAVVVRTGIIIAIVLRAGINITVVLRVVTVICLDVMAAVRVLGLGGSARRGCTGSVDAHIIVLIVVQRRIAGVI